MTEYYLMHKNEICGVMIYDEETGRVMNYQDNHAGLSPFLGNCDASRLRKWWEMRSIPASRSTLQDILRAAGCFTPGSYLAKNLALSMTDSYWIRPKDSSLSYADVNFPKLAAYHGGRGPWHNASTWDPNASLGGQMEKYWDLSLDTPVLVKESYRYYGQQSVNEAFAALLHERQNISVPFVRYTAVAAADRGIQSRCEAFTSENVEFIPAYEVVESEKIPNDSSYYDGYIELCTKAGIDREAIQTFMDYQTLTDFIISNTDEHLLNFGLLRDAESMKLLGPAPIFDSGNSMFYSEDRRYLYTRAGLLERRITGLYDREELLLKKIRNRHVVKIDLLPEPEEVKQIFAESGIPEWKADVISRNYALKLQLTREFQQGKTISLYREKQAEQKKRSDRHTGEPRPQKLILLCCPSGTEKEALVRRLQKELAEKGYREADPNALFSAEQAFSLSGRGLLLDRERILEKAGPVCGYAHCVVSLSLEAIRSELSQSSLHNAGGSPLRNAGESSLHTEGQSAGHPVLRSGSWLDELASALLDARMKAAFLSGASVLCDAPARSRSAREHYINIAEEAGVKSRELYVTASSLIAEMPQDAEGWTEIRRENGAFQPSPSASP